MNPHTRHQSRDAWQRERVNEVVKARQRVSEATAGMKSLQFLPACPVTLRPCVLISLAAGGAGSSLPGGSRQAAREEVLGIAHPRQLGSALVFPSESLGASCGAGDAERPRELAPSGIWVPNVIRRLKISTF